MPIFKSTSENNASANSEIKAEGQPPLPRSSWSSHVKYLRAVFKAKRALDQIERKNGNRPRG
jgi:hypothetical protein